MTPRLLLLVLPSRLVLRRKYSELVSYVTCGYLILFFSYLDAAAFVKAKINNHGVLALGYTQALRPGVKATFGLVPYTGILSSESSLDHIGPMARTVSDVAVLLQAIAGYDDLDDRQLGAPVPSALPSYISAIELPPTAPLTGITVGVLKE